MGTAEPSVEGGTVRLTNIRPGLALGLVCGWIASLGAQQNPHGQIPVGGLADAYLVLIRDPLVHRELRLNDQQRRAITAITDELEPAS